MSTRKYHPLLVALHWIVAVLIMMQLAGGFLGLSKIPLNDPEKLSALQIHMVGGMIIFALMAIRFMVRFRTKHPAPTISQQAGLGKLRTPLHRGFYVVVFAMVATGWYTGYLISGVYATPGAQLPSDFLSLPSRIAHGWIGLALVLLIALHIAAAIKERLMGDKTILKRMWFGKRAD